MRVTTNHPPTKASFTFLKDIRLYEREKPYYFAGELDPAQEHLRTNIEYEEINGVNVQDIRGYEHEFYFERDGVEIVNFDCALTSLAQGTTIPVDEYLEEVATFVKNKCQAEIAISYHYKVFVESKSPSIPILI